MLFRSQKYKHKKWFEKAAAQGHIEAKDYLQKLIADGFQIIQL